MKKKLFLILSLILISSMAKAICPKPWICQNLVLKVPYTTIGWQVGLTGPMLVPTVSRTTETIRAGYFPESGKFRGNILYFEGLGDSMLNHEPLFKELSRAGFRVVAFDYMGQGGSSGKMNRTRIEFIPWIGQAVWNKFARDIKKFQQKIIIGWSTGGLAAYMSATKFAASKVVLIAQGIVPNSIVGGGLTSWPINEITLDSLTSAAPYLENETNPHVDPIRPDSPAKVATFAIDLLATASVARDTKVPALVQGLVLLSGADDTYVDAKKTELVLKKNAPHFKVIQYQGALHEIDNEREEIQQKAIRDILKFLNVKP